MRKYYCVAKKDLSRVYYTLKSEALKHGRREKLPVFELTLTKNAVIQLLNSQGGYVERETQIYVPEEARG